MRNHFNALFAAHADVLKATQEHCCEALEEAAHQCIEAFQRGGKLWLFGNGGSAADALHLAAEFTGRYQMLRPGLAAVALTSDTAALTSIGNDFGFEHVFSRQIEALAIAGDVCIGFSTSGTSPNVVEGLKKARSLGCHTIGFTGKGGGDLPACCDVCLLVPDGVTSRIQEMHLFLGHCLVDAIETNLFPGPK